MGFLNDLFDWMAQLNVKYDYENPKYRCPYCGMPGEEHGLVYACGTHIVDGTSDFYRSRECLYNEIELLRKQLKDGE